VVTRLPAESRVWVDLDKIQLFDPDDGRNLTLGEGRRETEAAP
jgi:hypothetical protein